MLRAYKTPIFAKGQKLTHSPAHEEMHAGQETPLHYTPYLQWHHPGGRALCYGFEQQQRNSAAQQRNSAQIASRSRNRADSL